MLDMQHILKMAFAISAKTVWLFCGYFNILFMHLFILVKNLQNVCNIAYMCKACNIVICNMYVFIYFSKNVCKIYVILLICVKPVIFEFW